MTPQEFSQLGFCDLVWHSQLGIGWVVEVYDDRLNPGNSAVTVQFWHTPQRAQCHYNHLQIVDRSIGDQFKAAIYDVAEKNNLPIEEKLDPRFPERQKGMGWFRPTV